MPRSGFWSALAIVLCCVLVGLFLGASLPHDSERKAGKFDEYCRFVRTQLETTRNTLVGHDDAGFKQTIARKFYEYVPGTDRYAISRCGGADQATVDKIRGRCAPASTCAGVTCEISPACLVPVVDDLLRLLP